MKKLFMLIAFGVMTLSLSAQSKVAYCDVYVRGGGQNLRVTVMYDSNVHYFDHTNMGSILNVFAADGWTLDKDIVIPRNPIWSMFTRHKLHLIMKKEYKEGENPFKNLKLLDPSKTYTQTSNTKSKSNNPNKSTYSFSASQIEKEDISLYEVYGNDAIVIELSADCKHGKAIKTFNYKNDYSRVLAKCKKLGSGWRIPTETELLHIFKNKERVNSVLGYMSCELLYSSNSYWISDPTPATIKPKTLEKKHDIKGSTGYLIAILDF